MKASALGTTGKMARATQSDSKQTLLKWGNIVALVVMIGVNIAANVIPLGGVTTGEVSEAYPSLFTPAPMTFSIWGVIYALMVVFAVYQFGAGKAFFDGAVLRRDIGPWFMVSCLMNICWLICWHGQLLELSVVFMAGLLFCLITMSGRIDLLRERQLAGKLSVAGIQLYLGWIVAATIANVSVTLVRLGWDSGPLFMEFCTVVMLFVGAMLGVALSMASGMPVATLAVAWAYFGIAVRHTSGSGMDVEYPVLVAVALFGMAILLIAAALEIGRSCKCRRYQDEMWD